MRDGKLFVNPPRLLVEEVRLREVKRSEVKFKKENTTANTCVNSQAKYTIALHPNALLTGIHRLLVINM